MSSTKTIYNTDNLNLQRIANQTALQNTKPAIIVVRQYHYYNTNNSTNFTFITNNLDLTK